MKKTAIILTIVATITIIFSSCKKYEEGPSISILTKTQRVTGTWKCTMENANGEPFIITNTDNEEISPIYIFESDGTGFVGSIKPDATNIDSAIIQEMGWSFDQAKDSIRITTSTSVGWLKSEIIRLTNNEFWIRTGSIVGDTDNTIITKMEKL